VRRGTAVVEDEANSSSLWGKRTCSGSSANFSTLQVSRNDDGKIVSSQSKMIAFGGPSSRTVFDAILQYTCFL